MCDVHTWTFYATSKKQALIKADSLLKKLGKDNYKITSLRMQETRIRDLVIERTCDRRLIVVPMTRYRKR